MKKNIEIKSSSGEQFNETAYRRLKNRIINLTLPPGTKINEKETEQALNIGRTPIREALQRLANEGLVDYIPRKGYLVKPITIGDIKDIFEYMFYFERTAVFLAGNRIKPEQLDSLEEFHQKHKEAMKDKDYLGVAFYNGQFHRTIYQASGNSYMYQSMNIIHNQSQRLAYLCFTHEHPSPERRDYDQKAIEDHENIIKFLSQGNSAKAVEIITQHINQFSTRIYRYLNPTHIFDPLSNMPTGVDSPEG